MFITEILRVFCKLHKYISLQSLYKYKYLIFMSKIYNYIVIKIKEKIKVVSKTIARVTYCNTF